MSQAIPSLRLNASRASSSFLENETTYSIVGTYLTRLQGVDLLWNFKSGREERGPLARNLGLEGV